MSFPTKVRALVAERSGGVCEGCGNARAVEVHHRQYLSRGGRNTVENALHVCTGGAAGNIAGCHGLAHAGYVGESLGWAVRSRIDPLTVPVFRKNDRSWWVLADDGTKTQITAETAVGMLLEIGAIRDGIDVEFQGRWSRNQ